MPSAEEFLNDFFLTHEYDPAKRREYYLKTRQLKGRRVGLGKTVTRAVRHPTKQPQKKRTTTEQRVAALKVRLEKLQKALALLSAQTKANTSKKSSKSSSKPTHQTAKQKADSAKRSKEYREKNKPASQEVKELQAKIKAIQEKIKLVRAQLAAEKKRKAKRNSGVDRVGRSVINK